MNNEDKKPFEMTPEHKAQLEAARALRAANGDYDSVGRPTVMSPEILVKLEQAFALGCSDIEACLYANIGKTTLYNYQNEHPEFLEHKNELKEKPVLLARQTILNNIKEPDVAQWYLERKVKKEFSARQELTGAEGNNLIPQPILGGLSKNDVPTNDLDQKNS